MNARTESMDFDNINFDLEKFEEALSEYKTAHETSESIKANVSESIKAIKDAWTGSDDVISARDADFAKIEEKLDEICNSLSETNVFLADKKDSLTKAGRAYMG